MIDRCSANNFILYAVVCDKCGVRYYAPNQCHVDFIARAYAELAGWTYVVERGCEYETGIDVCPKCQKGAK